MTSAILPLAASTPLSWRAVARATLIVGSLDLCLALGVQFMATGGMNLVRILHTIAAGLIGAGAREGGAATAVLGVALHYLIAGTWTTIFAVALSRLRVVRALTVTQLRQVLTGFAWGLVIWMGMNFVVLPLSQLHAMPRFTSTTPVMIAGHAVLIGIPIVLILANGTRRPR
jgi:hypothetical protein